MNGSRPQAKVKVKSFDVPKSMVWEAFQRVKANKGAPGADGVTIEQYEQNLSGNLFKLWNRMSSGSYFPPAVKAVEIPKADGKGIRVLGVPTVSDRIAQTVAAMYLERAVAGCAVGEGGRIGAATESWDSPRVGDFSRAGESVSALRVRCVAGAGVPAGHL
ncbi:hypothetical protein [Streptosporangium sp. NPDC002607]